LTETSTVQMSRKQDAAFKGLKERRGRGDSVATAHLEGEGQRSFKPRVLRTGAKKPEGVTKEHGKGPDHCDKKQEKKKKKKTTKKKKSHLETHFLRAGSEKLVSGSEWCGSLVGGPNVGKATIRSVRLGL